LTWVELQAGQIRRVFIPKRYLWPLTVGGYRFQLWDFLQI
jgi:hypothetical protein